MMETIDDYADRAEQAVRSAVAHAVFVLGQGSTPIRAMSAEWLDILLEAADPVRVAEVAMERDGLTTFTDPRDGLRYVTSEVAA